MLLPFDWQLKIWERRAEREMAGLLFPDGAHTLDAVPQDRPATLGVLGRDPLRQDGELVHQPDLLLRRPSAARKNDHRSRRISDRIQRNVSI